MSKKIILSVLAILVVIAIAATATFAFLKKESNGVHNTFVSGDDLIDKPDNPDDPDPDFEENGFYILETKNDGSEELTDGGNEYTVVPGVDLDKDAFVRINGKTEVPSYMFIAIEEDLPDTLTYEVTDSWTLLEGVTTENGGAVYAYTTTVDDTTDLSHVAIFVDDTITVSAEIEEGAEIDASIDIYGYLCQAATFDSAADAWAGCFAD